VSLVEEVIGPETGGLFDARTFLEFLDPSADHWWDNGSNVHSPWVFRGHRDAQWKLVPSAARPEEHLTPEFLNVVKAVKSELPNKVRGWSSRSPELNETIARAVASARCINHFLRLANDLGKRILLPFSRRPDCWSRQGGRSYRPKLSVGTQTTRAQCFHRWPWHNIIKFQPSCLIGHETRW